MAQVYHALGQETAWWEFGVDAWEYKTQSPGSWLKLIQICCIVTVIRVPPEHGDLLWEFIKFYF